MTDTIAMEPGGRAPKATELGDGATGGAPPGAKEDEYAIVEIFGHRRHAGRIQEVERFGTRMLRIDVPTDGDFARGFVTHLYGGASIFSLIATDRASVEAANAPYRPPGRLTYKDDGARGAQEPADDEPF